MKHYCCDQIIIIFRIRDKTIIFFQNAINRLDSVTMFRIGAIRDEIAFIIKNGMIDRISDFDFKHLFDIIHFYTDLFKHVSIHSDMLSFESNLVDPLVEKILCLPAFSVCGERT